MTPQPSRSTSSGFTLMELAVVLVIVALLIGGMLVPLSAQNDIRYVTETQKTLNDIRDALIGYAAANGRLPCPASASSSGVEEPAGGGNCDLSTAGNSYGGFVPAVTLGIGPTNSNGYAIDAWGNPIRYAVYPKQIGTQQNPFTTGNGMKTATMSSIATTDPLLSICACGGAVVGKGTAAAACDSSATVCAGMPGKVTDQAVAVIYSLGKNAGTGGTGAGEQHNPNPNSPIAPDPAFVWHTATPAGSSDGEFDDMLVWVSPNILYNRLIAAGQLP